MKIYDIELDGNAGVFKTAETSRLMIKSRNGINYDNWMPTVAEVKMFFDAGDTMTVQCSMTLFGFINPDEPHCSITDMTEVV